MSHELPPLNPLRVFESAARHLNFTAAAEELHITQGAVSHQIKALEVWLGFELFDRTARRLRLTRGGENYAHQLNGVFARIIQATQELMVSSSHQILTVRGHTTFFVRWLIPFLPRFQAAYPDIRVKLSANVEGVDFRREQADVGIVYGDGPWTGLYSNLLFTDQLTPVMAPALAARLPAGCSTEALLALPLLHSNRRPQQWPDWIGACGATREHTASDMVCEDLSIVYQCAIEGLGVALGQLPYLEKELAQGQLIAPHQFILRRSRGYYLVCPDDHAEEPKVACFRQWLLAQIAGGAQARTA
jgi:LysR family glycine cleavage system transcriptional activator